MPIRSFIFLPLGIILAIRAAESVPPSAVFRHQDLSYYTRPDGSRALIHTAADWEQRRAQIVAGLEQVMGPLPRPTPPVPLDVHVLEEHKEVGYIRRKVAYHTDDAKLRVHAWLLVPSLSIGSQRPGNSHPESKQYPAVLCLHQTTPSGKDSVVGLADRPTLHYAKELALRGYVTLSPDYPSFGEYKGYDFKSGAYLSGTMKAICDNMRGVDLLQSLPEVDGKQIGCIGHSLGGHNTLFTAVFDSRIKAAITCCGFTSFHKYKGGDLRGWASPRYMPLIATKYNNSADLMPFDFAEVVAAISPRSVFVVAPLHDDNFDVEGVRDVLKSATPIYQLLGQPDRLQAVYPDSKHDFPDTERNAAYEFLDRNLRPSDGPDDK
jgi:dienelactone hydrolase